MENIKRIVLAWELYEEGLSRMSIASRLGLHRETIGIWIKGIEREGLEGFLDSYEKAKKVPRRSRQVDPILKRRVWSVREREHGVKLSVPKIYEILAEKYVIRSKWKKNQKRGAIPVASGAREVLQFDSISFGGVFAFTAIDIWSKEADVLLRPALTSEDGLSFLEVCMARRFGGHTQLLQTDGGSEFKDQFLEHVLEYCERHRVARLYKKNEQSYIESFNRTVRKERTYKIYKCRIFTENYASS